MVKERKKGLQTYCGGGDAICDKVESRSLAPTYSLQGNLTHSPRTSKWTAPSIQPCLFGLYLARPALFFSVGLAKSISNRWKKKKKNL